MTIVHAKKFGDRIVMMSDTMITDASKGRNTIPGRLKSIVLSKDVSVAYAGNAGEALSAIRIASDVLRSKGLDAMLQFLRQQTTDGECDFLTASHTHGPELRKIRESHVSEPLEESCIGDSEAITALRQFELQQTDGKPLTAEDNFISGFVHGFLKSPASITNTVCGFAINHLASPNGHTYQSHAGAVAWDEIDLSRGSTAEQVADRSSGKTEFRYNIISPSRVRAAPVLGAYLEQAATGYIYAPLQHDEAQMRRNTSMNDIASEVDELAAESKLRQMNVNRQR